MRSPTSCPAWGRLGGDTREEATMRRVILAAVFVAAGLLTGAPSEAECAFCGSYTCVDQTACFDGCACVTATPGMPGKCLPVNR